MSSNLEAWPAEPIGSIIIADEIKFVLRNRYGNPINTVLIAEELDYLYGLRDSGFVTATINAS